MISTGRKMAKRRGTRIPCDISAILTTLVPDHSLSESCQILLINPQGCVVRYRYPLKIGTIVQLAFGLPRSTKVVARVVNCISMGQHENFWLLGLALEEPGNVWGVPNPPLDWD